MGLSFVDGRNLHVIFEKVGEICIGIIRRGELFPFEFYCCERKNGVASVVYSVAVTDGKIAHMVAGVAEQLIGFEDCIKKNILSSEPKVFSERAEAVVVLTV